MRKYKFTKRIFCVPTFILFLMFHGSNVSAQQTVFNDLQVNGKAYLKGNVYLTDPSSNGGISSKLILGSGIANGGFHSIGLTNYWTELISHTNEGWRFKSTSGNGIYKNNLVIFASTGNTGINVENPTRTLDIGGNLRIRSLSTPSNAAISYVVADVDGNLFKTNLNLPEGINEIKVNTTNSNISMGKSALLSNTTGRYAVAIGENSLKKNTTGGGNIAIGAFSLENNLVGFENVAIGVNSLQTNNSNRNTAIGWAALYAQKDGHLNTAVGYRAGQPYATNSSSTFLGAESQSSASIGGVFNTTVIGWNAIGYANNQIRLGNTGVSSIVGQVPWTSLSDKRFKINVKNNIPGLTFINKLTPVSYNLDAVELSSFIGETRDSTYLDALNTKSQIVYSGFLAQDVEKIAKELKYNFSGVDAPQNEGGLYGLRYTDFIASIVKSIQELSKENDYLKSIISNLEADFNELKSDVAEIKSVLPINPTPPVDKPFLGQNVPNPFGNSTFVPVHIPQKYQNASLMLYDISGKKVINTIPIFKEQTSIEIHVNNLPNGIYGYALYLEGELFETKKMLISK